MSYDIRKFHGHELLTFKQMIEKYMSYDRIDLLVHKTLKILGISKEEFKNRKVKEKEKKEYIKKDAPAPELYFCDGDKCEFDPTKLGKC